MNRAGILSPLSQTRDIAQRVLVLVDEAQCQRIVAERWRPDFALLIALFAEPDDFRLGSLRLEIHNTNPLVPTGIRLAAGVIILRRVPPTFVGPAHAASS